MSTKLNAHAQITIPEEIIVKLGLSEGDDFEVYEENGMIHIMPVVVYPDAYLQKLNEEMEKMDEGIENGTQPVFSDVEEMFKWLEEHNGI